jgi:site-specific recombinase XerD
MPELRIHDLRHSFASFLVNSGRSLYEVQRLLGHTSSRTTQRYAHLSDEALTQAMSSASGWVKPAPATSA